MEEALVFVDHGYLNKISRELGEGPLLYDISKLSATFAGVAGLKCSHVFLYTAPPFQGSRPTQEELGRKAKYDKFVARIKSLPNLTLREGRVQKIGDIFKQKGVDTLLTMDLFTKPREYNVKKIILVACDTDFVPLLNEIRKNGIEVVLFYYTDRIRRSKFSMSNHILTACDRKFMITKNHFLKSAIK